MGDVFTADTEFLALCQRLAPFNCGSVFNLVEMWFLRNDGDSGSSSDYRVGEVLNKGKTGEVMVAINKKGKTVVLKKIDSATVEEELINNEVECGKKLKHTNIVKVHKIFRENTHTFLEMEYLDGEDLYFFMEERDFQPIPEDETKKIFRQLVKALLYIHQKGFAHRDLKLENVIISKKTGKIKLLDFGLATKIPTGDLCTTWCGSIGYVCPEIMMRVPYNGYKADIWSLGTILYSLLFAELPFLFNDRVQAILNGRPHPSIEFPENVSVTFEAKDLIRKMIQVDPKKRITLKEVANHPWLKGLGNGESPKVGNGSLRKVKKMRMKMKAHTPSFPTLSSIKLPTFFRDSKMKPVLTRVNVVPPSSSSFAKNTAASSVTTDASSTLASSTPSSPPTKGSSKRASS